jgi:hypothetical protein
LLKNAIKLRIKNHKSWRITGGETRFFAMKLSLKSAFAPIAMAASLLATTALTPNFAQAADPAPTKPAAVTFAANNQTSTNATKIPVIDNRGKPYSMGLAMSASKGGAVSVLVNADKKDGALSSAVCKRIATALRGLRERGYKVGIVVQDGDPRQAVVLTSVNSPDGDHEKDMTHMIELTGLGDNADTGAHIALAVTRLYDKHIGKPDASIAAADLPAGKTDRVLASVGPQ